MKSFKATVIQKKSTNIYSDLVLQKLMKLAFGEREGELKKEKREERCEWARE